MSARRCNPCSANWPATLNVDGKIEQFLSCPECDEKTDFFVNAAPMDNDEARSRLLHARFESWCKENGRNEAV